MFVLLKCRINTAGVFVAYLFFKDQVSFIFCAYCFVQSCFFLLCSGFVFVVILASLVPY